jgi:hypothetical protein
VRDRRLPDIWEANRITAVTAASDEAIDRVLAQAERSMRTSAIAASMWTSRLPRRSKPDWR